MILHSLVRSVAGGYRCLRCDALFDLDEHMHASSAECVSPFDRGFGKSPAQTALPSAREIAGMAADPEAQMEGTIDLRPGAVNYALQKDRDNPPAYVSHDWQDLTLVDFCEAVGIKLGPWQRQFLEELDQQRGLPNKS